MTYTRIAAKFLALAGLSVALSSCRPELDAPTPTTNGQVDLTRYVALGNSLTAGYGDGALYRSGQENSFPNFLASRFALAGGGNFTQALLPEGAGFGAAGNGRFTLTSLLPSPVIVQNNPPSITPLSPTWRPSDATVIAANGNLGVPGMRLIEVAVPGLGNPANGAGNFNPFFTRIAANPATSSVLKDAYDKRPTFFTFALGFNDVLGYATSGGASGAISNPATFAFVYQLAVDSLLKATPTTKGIVSNIPDLTQAAFFRTVGPQVAATLPVPGIYYRSKTGDTLFVAKARLADQNNILNPLLLLTANGRLGVDGGTGGAPNGIPDGLSRLDPLPSSFVLDSLERADFKAAVDAYNASINAYVTAVNARPAGKRLVILDAVSMFNRWNAGSREYSVDINLRYITGGVHALDGIHLTPRGYALVANEIITTMNKGFGTSIPLIDAFTYPGILLPN